MTENRIETTQGLCVVALTRHLMEKFQIPMEDGYQKLLEMDLYSLLMDPETRLFMETNDYLCKCCDIEISGEKDSLYKFINE